MSSTNDVKDKDIKALTTLKTFDALPDQMKHQITFMLQNPDSTKVVRLSDNQRGSTSNMLYGLIANIDLVKPVMQDIINFKTQTKSLEDFFSAYAEYGTKYHAALELLRELEKDGIELLKHIKNPKDIRNRRLRARVFPDVDNTVKKEATPATKKTEAKNTEVKKDEKSTTGETANK
jgi:hypothetical protein